MYFWTRTTLLHGFISPTPGEGKAEVPLKVDGTTARIQAPSFSAPHFSPAVAVTEMAVKTQPTLEE